MKNEVNKLNGTENKIPTRRELYQEIERLKKRIAELENENAVLRSLIKN